MSLLKKRSIRKRYIVKDTNIFEEKKEVTKGKDCLKYNNTENIVCKKRYIDNINNLEYKPKELGTWIDNNFGGDNFVGGLSPFEYSNNYSKKSEEEICNPNEFQLQPHQKFAGQLINPNTNINGQLIYHLLGSGKTCTSLVIAEAMKKRAINKGKFTDQLKGRSPFEVIIVTPKAIVSQYYEEIMGKIKNGNIASCTGACLIDDYGRQIYVGKYVDNKYSIKELEEIENLKNIMLNKKGSEFEKLKRELNILQNEYKKKIDTVYYITSHTKFLNKIMSKDNISGNFYANNFLISQPYFKSENSLLIIDEIQKLISENGNYFQKLYYSLMIYCRNINTGTPTVKVVGLTATPVYDNPYEAAMIFNLFRPRIQFPLNKDKFDEMFIEEGKIKNQLLLKYCMSGYVSYFKGGSPKGYPERINEIKGHRMSKNQEYQYENILISEIGKDINKSLYQENKSNKTTAGVYNRTLQRCNISYPLNEDEEEDYDLFIKVINKHKTENLRFKEIQKWSTKFAWIYKTVLESPGPVFIYTNFVKFGILGLSAIFDSMGWNFINKQINISSTKLNYSVWSPTALEYKNIKDIESYTTTIRNIFNNPLNSEGQICKVLISNVVEGISLKNISQVHLCDPWWNYSKVEQIIARGIRLCSHYGNNITKKVNVYYHYSKYQSYPNLNTSISEGIAKYLNEDIKNLPLNIINYRNMNLLTIEQKMYYRSSQKQKLNVEFELLLKESATDCNLNSYGNIVKLEPYKFENINEILYYNRSLDNYYRKISNKKFELVKLNYDINVKQLFSKAIFNIKIWPPVNYDKTNIIIYSDENNIIKENIKCDISTIDKNFNELYEIAMKKGEEYNVWNYMYKRYIKLKNFGNLLIKYKMIQSENISEDYIKCLYKLLLNSDTIF